MDNVLLFSILALVVGILVGSVVVWVIFTFKASRAMNKANKFIEDAKKEKDERSDTFSFPIQAQDAAEPLEPASQEDIDFWGSGFTVDVYAEFNKRYEGWTGGKEITDPSERALYKQICILETTIGRDAAQGKAIDKNINEKTMDGACLMGSFSSTAACTMEAG